MFVSVGRSCSMCLPKFFSHENQKFPHLTRRFLIRGTVQISYFSHHFMTQSSGLSNLMGSELWLPFLLSCLHTEIYLGTKDYISGFFFSVGIAFENARCSRDMRAWKSWCNRCESAKGLEFYRVASNYSWNSDLFWNLRFSQSVPKYSWELPRYLSEADFNGYNDIFIS